MGGREAAGWAAWVGGSRVRHLSSGTLGGVIATGWPVLHAFFTRARSLSSASVALHLQLRSDSGHMECMEAFAAVVTPTAAVSTPKVRAGAARWLFCPAPSMTGLEAPVARPEALTT